MDKITRVIFAPTGMPLANFALYSEGVQNKKSRELKTYDDETASGTEPKSTVTLREVKGAVECIFWLLWTFWRQSEIFSALFKEYVGI